jgi:CO/xanthine dehydrogenase FAD-binding subunit
MKPPLFSYAAPETLDDCVALLAQYSDDAKILAGGQSLMPLLNLRMVRPAVIVDIGRVQGLDLWANEERSVRIGALVRQSALETDRSLASAVPLLAEAIALIGHPATRSRGTIVGSMCHADPAAELPVCAVLLNAEFLLRSSKGDRVVKADEFFQDALSTTARADEIVESIRLPMGSVGNAGYAFDEIARRHGDFALVSVAAAIENRDGGAKACVALGGVGTRPLTFHYGEFAPGEPIEPSRFEGFGHYVADRIEPNTDLHATADYRRAIAVVLVERTLCTAWRRTQGQS